MSKKTNTLLFILAATLTNITLVLLSFLLFFILYSVVLRPLLPANSVIWALGLIFLAALIVSFVVYQALLKLFTKKVDVQKYFDPIFNTRRK
ncbi:hypothetical protein AGMMS4952_15020 [Spirochaetia bacterium]|nr:hypothetical protein AGMMS4952_15020 [Spirochaetia bacterium]